MLQTVVACCLGVASAIFAFTIAAGLTGSSIVAAVVALLVAALVQLTRLTVFMVDASRPGYSRRRDDVK